MNCPLFTGNLAAVFTPIDIFVPFCTRTDGLEGLAPHIPPNSALSFDLTLLGFRARSPWVKPLIQDNNTHEKPYHADLKIYMEVRLFLRGRMCGWS